MAALNYNYAIICRIPSTFADRAVKDPSKNINLEVAREEYNQLKDTLKSCDINIIELQDDDNYPDCCFVEDTAITIGGTALIARPGHETRQGEVGEIRRVLRNDLRMNVVEIGDSKATLDGGDVLFTGKEIFVGYGNRTNQDGAKAVVDAFPEYHVSPIKIGGLNVLHLKDVVTMAGRDILAVGSGDAAKKILQQMKTVASFRYQVLQLSSEVAADMLYLNGRLIHRTREEMGDASYRILDEKIPYTRRSVSLNEVGKAYGTIGGMVLLVSKHRSQKKVVSNITEDDIMPFACLKD